MQRLSLEEAVSEAMGIPIKSFHRKEKIKDLPKEDGYGLNCEGETVFSATYKGKRVVLTDWSHSWRCEESDAFHADGFHYRVYPDQSERSIRLEITIQKKTTNYGAIEDANGRSTRGYEALRRLSEYLDDRVASR